jgi:hypothetical protein
MLKLLIDYFFLAVFAVTLVPFAAFGFAFKYLNVFLNYMEGLIDKRILKADGEAQEGL